MRIAVIDFECCCVPPEPANPIVCEVAVKVVDFEAGEVFDVQVFHSTVLTPFFLAHLGTHAAQVKHVMKNVVGMEFPVVHGLPITSIIKAISPILSSATLILANDPKLERRILANWGLGYLDVQDIHDFLTISLKARRSRPCDLKHKARKTMCAAHGHELAHCALVDVNECVEWIRFVGLDGSRVSSILSCDEDSAATGTLKTADDVS